jgi:hypothetical protein
MQGDEDIETTARYLGGGQEIAAAVSHRIATYI